MSIKCRLLSLALMFSSVLGMSVALAEDDGAEESTALSIGSKAPALDIEHWVSDGEGKFKHIKEFEKGKVYVVEFWATWCGPCVRSMPHLAELQEKYGEQGVTLISISDEDLDTVTRFLEKEVPNSKKTYGELTSVYCLTTDPDRSVSKDYMEAAGQNGIPTSFLVGKDGHIEWIGHPMYLDDPERGDVLKNVLNDSWDREAEAKQFRKQQEVELAMMRLSQLLGTGKVDEALGILNKLIDSTDDDAMVAQLKNIRFRVLMMQGGDAAMEAIEKMAEASADDAQQLNEIAWNAYQMLNQMPSSDEKLVAAALGVAEKAAKVAPEDGSVLDTLAHLVHFNGDLDRAIELQTKAVEFSADPQLKQITSRFLKQLQDEKEEADEEANEE